MSRMFVVEETSNGTIQTVFWMLTVSVWCQRVGPLGDSGMAAKTRQVQERYRKNVSRLHVKMRALKGVAAPDLKKETLLQRLKSRFLK